MALEGGVKMKGLRNLDRTLRSLPDKVRRKALGAASLEMARVARHTARRLVRVRTGRLKRSIVAKRKRVRGKDGRIHAGAVLKAGARWAAHASLIEYGTRRARAFPFIRPATRLHHGRMIRAARGRIARLLPRMIRQAQGG